VRFTLFAYRATQVEVVDHTAKSGRRVRGGLACIGRDKVFYAGGLDGHLYEECLQGDGKEWQVSGDVVPVLRM
jgi:hypothetical protein